MKVGKLLYLQKKNYVTTVNLTWPQPFRKDELQIKGPKKGYKFLHPRYPFIFSAISTGLIKPFLTIIGAHLLDMFPAEEKKQLKLEIPYQKYTQSIVAAILKLC